MFTPRGGGWDRGCRGKVRRGLVHCLHHLTNKQVTQIRLADMRYKRSSLKKTKSRSNQNRNKTECDGGGVQGDQWTKRAMTWGLGTLSRQTLSNTNATVSFYHIFPGITMNTDVALASGVCQASFTLSLKSAIGHLIESLKS